MYEKDVPAEEVRISSNIHSDDYRDKFFIQEYRIQKLEEAYEDDAMRAMGYIQ